MPYIDRYGSCIYDYFLDSSAIKSCWLPFVKPSACFDVPSKRGNFRTRYVQLMCSLDIETTTKGDYSAPYIMTVGLNIPGEDTFYNYHLRSWEDVQALFDRISTKYGLGNKRFNKDKKCYVEYEGKRSKAKRVLLCFIHNASYEFAFMRSELKFAKGEYDFFTKDSRKMMKAALENGVEFRDSMALTNSSLQQLAKMYTKHQKIKDLDYTKQRHTHSKLDPDELRYINDDTIILNEFEKFYFDKMCMPGQKIPMTNTARLLLKVKNKIGPMIDQVIAAMQKIQPTASETMEASRYLFRGGYVHGNIRYIDSIVPVLMRDITSSYPYTMLTKYMPVGKFCFRDLEKKAWIYGKDPEEFRELLRKYCIIMDVTYYGLKAITDHSYESVSKCKEFIADDKIKSTDNGRIRNAEMIRVMQTELDYEIYKSMYKWDCMEVNSIYFADRGMLPDWLQECIAEDYKRKNDLKKAGLQDTTDYTLAKVDVNTYFGMCCKAVYQNNVKYDYDLGEWYPEEAALNDIQADLDTRFLNFYWGVWITAHSRLKLVRMLHKIERAGGHVVYYDTDSLKYIPSGVRFNTELSRWEKTPDGKTEAIFEEENKRIAEERKQFPILSDPAFWGDSGEGLGEWDPEVKQLCPFKTLGAKRYLYYDSSAKWKYKTGYGWYKPYYHLCVAGLPKAAVELLPNRPFDFFSKTGFSFKGEDTGKLRPVYHDDPYSVAITDESGTTETISCKTGVTLKHVDFDITDKKLFNIILQNMEFLSDRRNYIFE